MKKPSAAFYKQEVGKAIAAIEFLKTHKNPKTPEDKELLLGFCGGGVFKEAGIFTDTDRRGWVVEMREKLRSLITPAEWASLQNAGMLNAHYTKREIAAEIWRFVASFLKPGDKVLDPGCGTGRFYLDCPADFKYVGVDSEPLSAAIAKAAHGGASIYCKDFLEWKYPQEFQAVVGNIPFVNGVKTYYLEGQKLTLGLHAQFFCKSIFHLQEGGVLALLTSIDTLDAKGEDYVAFRRWMDKQCHFLGAVRLPIGAVHDGGTEVTTDLILLKKRKLGDKTPNPNWTGTVETGLAKQYMEKTEEIRINQWYKDYPQFMLGDLGFDPLTQGKRSAAIARVGQDAIADLRKALNKIKGGGMGYTHRWWQPRMLNSKEFEAFMKSVKRLAKASGIPLFLEENYEKPPVETFILFNGLGEDRYEDAIFVDCQEEKEDWDESKGLFKSYCKTNQATYDPVVFAAMLAFVYHFPDDVKIGSDGELAAGDFDEGIALFEKVFGLKVEIEQPDPTRSSVPLVVKFVNKKEAETMTTANKTQWEAFQVKFVDKKGKEPGDAAVQLWFPDKPPEKVTDTLSSVGFHYHENGVKYWYAYLSEEVSQAMQDKGIKSIEAFVRGLVKTYCFKGAHVSQEKPKPEAPPTAATPQGGMLKMLKEMADDLRALRGEVAELKNSSANSAELEKLKAQHEAEIAKLDDLNLRMTQRIKDLQEENEKIEKRHKEKLEEIAKRDLTIANQNQTLVAATKKIADLEVAVEEKDRIIAEKKEAIAVAVSEVDRLSDRYDTLTKSIIDQGFAVEDFLGATQTEEETPPISFDDDTPAISFDDGEEPEPVADDTEDSGGSSSSDSVGTATDSEGFDLDELDESEGFDTELLDSLGE